MSGATKTTDGRASVNTASPARRQFLRWTRTAIWLAAVLLILAACRRYAAAPTFWLDEARIAVTIKTRTVTGVLGRLSGGLFFPRFYLLVIAALSHLVGYRIWVLRLLPFLAFIAGTLVWARLLVLRAGRCGLACLLAAVLLLGSDYWLAESIQLKQYTMDVLLSLVPFVLSDSDLDAVLSAGRKKWLLIALAIPCALSCTYPLALMARVAGWYLARVRSGDKTLRWFPAGVLVAAALSGVLLYSIQDLGQAGNLAGFRAYWASCSLRTAFTGGPIRGARVISNFIWGWQYGRLMILLAVVLAPLQATGAFKAFSSLVASLPRGQSPGPLRNYKSDGAQDKWGSRTAGSIILLAAVVVASALIGYPICAGRLVLFAQPHIHIITLEGAVFVLSSRPILGGNARSYTGILVRLVVLAAIAGSGAYSITRFRQFVFDEAHENIKPLIAKMNPALADTVWVQGCSEVQVESLPNSLPVSRIAIGRSGRPLPGERVWVLWTHMDPECEADLASVKASSSSWKIVAEGPDRGLALAQF